MKRIYLASFENGVSDVSPQGKITPEVDKDIIRVRLGEFTHYEGDLGIREGPVAISLPASSDTSWEILISRSKYSNEEGRLDIHLQISRGAVT